MNCFTRVSPPSQPRALISLNRKTAGIRSGAAAFHAIDDVGFEWVELLDPLRRRFAHRCRFALTQVPPQRVVHRPVTRASFRMPCPVGRVIA